MSSESGAASAEFGGSIENDRRCITYISVPSHDNPKELIRRSEVGQPGRSRCIDLQILLDLLPHVEL